VDEGVFWGNCYIEWTGVGRLELILDLADVLAGSVDAQEVTAAETRARERILHRWCNVEESSLML
jgi:hypothetical protein